MRNNRQKGFSLIELLIVVAIILIIAAIAIPNLLRSKMAANEASAVASLRTLNTSAILYSTTFATLPSCLANMGPDATGGNTPVLTGADLIDSVLAGGVAGAAPVAGVNTATKSGYLITYTPTAPVAGVTPSYTIEAQPTSQNGTGFRSFFTDQTGVIRADTSGVAGAATAASTPI
jgi:prepilin-type N-terminal cleavage/methylation domain-containing protein